MVVTDYLQVVVEATGTRERHLGGELLSLEGHRTQRVKTEPH